MALTNKKFLCTLALSCIVLSGFSQTRRIARHSHSGTEVDYNAEVTDNFGISPQMEARRDSIRQVKKQQQDSLKIANYRDSLNKSKTAAPQKKDTKNKR